MVFGLLLFAFLAASNGAPVADLPLQTPNDFNPHPFQVVSIVARELPECLKNGRYRTTPQIIWTCLATIFACTWVAIHPNLPGPRDSGFQRLRRKIAMMFVATMAPELISIWAVKQLTAARQIKKTFNQKFNNDVDPELSPLELLKQWFTGPPEKARGGWSLAHGFFVQMGGFMVYHDGKPVEVLTFDRLLRCIETGEVDPDALHIPEEDVTDKSKGDGLTKAVVIAQMLWFTAQCIGRGMSHLPLAEIEVLTLAFAVLNAYTYVLWWFKPQGVLVPIKVPLRTASQFPPEKAMGRTPTTDTCSETSTLLDADKDADSLTGKSSDLSESFDKESFHWFHIKFGNTQPFCSMSALERVRFTLTILPRICSATIAYLARVAIKPLQFGSYTPAAEIATFDVVGRTRVPMFYAGPLNLEATNDTILDMIIRALTGYMVPIIFGALHLLSWSAFFPTHLEQLFWRVSALYLTAIPVIIVLLYFLFRKADSYFPGVFNSLHPPVYKLSLVVYSVARCTLIYISFATLRQLPERGYHDVRWGDFFPHI